MHCPHIEGIKGLSPLTEFEGGAIKKNVDTGEATLRLGFPLAQAEQRKFSDIDRQEQLAHEPRPRLTRLKPLVLLLAIYFITMELGALEFALYRAIGA